MLISLGKFAHLAEQTAMKWTLLGIEGMTMLFWLSGFVSLGVFLNGRICFGMVSVISIVNGDVSGCRSRFPEAN